MTRRYDRSRSSDYNDSDGSDDRERRDSSDADTDDGGVRDAWKTRGTSRKVSGLPALIPRLILKGPPRCRLAGTSFFLASSFSSPSPRA